MATIVFPTLSRLPATFDMGLVSNTMTFTSPLSASVQTIEMPAMRWRFSFSMQDLDAADAGLIQAFLAQLRGQAGRFTMYDLSAPYTRGVITGSPVVNGAGQTGTSLATSGWDLVTPGNLEIGDKFSVGGELKIVTSAAISDGAGMMTINFEPPLRTAPTNGSAINFWQPTAIFKLTSDDNGWSVKAPYLTTVNIQGIEVI